MRDDSLQVVRQSYSWCLQQMRLENRAWIFVDAKGAPEVIDTLSVSMTAKVSGSVAWPRLGFNKFNEAQTGNTGLSDKPLGNHVQRRGALLWPTLTMISVGSCPNPSLCLLNLPLSLGTGVLHLQPEGGSACGTHS